MYYLARKKNSRFTRYEAYVSTICSEVNTLTRPTYFNNTLEHISNFVRIIPDVSQRIVKNKPLGNPKKKNLEKYFCERI